MTATRTSSPALRKRKKLAVSARKAWKRKAKRSWSWSSDRATRPPPLRPPFCPESQSARRPSPLGRGSHERPGELEKRRRQEDQREQERRSGGRRAELLPGEGRRRRSARRCEDSGPGRVSPGPLFLARFTPQPVHGCAVAARSNEAQQGSR